MELSVLEESIEAISSVVGPLDCSGMDGARAAKLVELFSRGERLCAAGKAEAARRVSETGFFELEGARDAAEWLASVTGESRTAASELLDTARKLSELPSSLGEAFRSGELSGKQANEIRKAAERNPEKTDELVDLAPTTSLRDLKEQADKVIAAALSREEDEARHARVHAERHLYTRTRDGAFSGEFSLTPEAGAHLLGALESLAKQFFEEARQEGRYEPHAAYMADALVALANNEGQARQGGPSYEVIMRVDLEALVRGDLKEGEACTIDHVGHVPVSLVQSYLDRAKVRLFVERSEELDSIFSFKRNIPKALDLALRERDRTCVVPGCKARFNLERDHIRLFSKKGPTTLSNLVTLCRRHHRLKTNYGFAIEGRPGAWRWLKPDGSPAGPFTAADGSEPPAPQPVLPPLPEHVLAELGFARAKDSAHDRSHPESPPLEPAAAPEDEQLFLIC